MKIESGRGVGPSSSTRRASATAAPGFAPAAEEAHKPAATSGVGGVTALDAILALQVDEQPAGRRSRQARRGREALDLLEKLERALVLGHAPAALRGELDRAQRGAEATGEPGLDEILREIDIRLAVEAAKLERLLGQV